MAEQQSLTNLTQDDLKNLLETWGEPPFRAGQIWDWLYRQYVTSFDEMTNLPKQLRQRLAAAYILNPLRPIATLNSTDGLTTKTLFILPDKAQIEAVLMRYNKRRTLCISTQAGCALDCPFCATGQMGFLRNLTAGEIVAQVLYYSRRLKAGNEQVTNLVFMGMGEPLANYAASWQAIRRLNNPGGFNLGARRMTLSTVGLVPAIRRMSREPERVGLAVSLHAPTDAVRDKLVPLNRRYPLATLMQACRDYVAATGRRITFEYALMDGQNDSPAQADQLAKLLAGLRCHVNLIPLNPTPGSPYRGSPQERVYAFQDRLQKQAIPTTVRLRRGIDIEAGCGQLQTARAAASQNT
ncbi:MAG: 23S rRNA (adenine(2503)-C(2))-methyltransferase RlmN [Anaerolineae bacterium]